MDDRQFRITMEHIIEALKEKGYDPHAQLMGYITENEPAYITSYKDARKQILPLDIELVKQYVDKMK